MARKSNTNGPESDSDSASDADKLVEAIQVLSGAVEHANQNLSMIADELGRIRDDLSWLLNNREEVGRIIRKLPLDPADRNWSAKLAALNQPRESIRCQQCNVESPDSLAAAVLCGWANLAPDDGDDLQQFTGTCPTCAEKEKPPEKPAETIFCTCCPSTIVGMADALRAGWTCLIDDEGNERGNFAGECPACSENPDAPKYRVRTYDINTGKFTPQAGIPEIVTGHSGLRKAIRALREMGYPADRSGDCSDSSVLIERMEPAEAEAAAKLAATPAKAVPKPRRTLF